MIWCNEFCNAVSTGSNVPVFALHCALQEQGGNSSPCSDVNVMCYRPCEWRQCACELAGIACLLQRCLLMATAVIPISCSHEMASRARCPLHTGMARFL